MSGCSSGRVDPAPSRSPRRVACCSGTPRRSWRACTRLKRTWPRWRSGEGGRLRVGTFQSVGARVLPAVMRRFTRGVAARRDRADGVDLRRGAAAPRRAGRARSRVCDAAAARRAVRSARAACGPVRPARAGRARARRAVAREPRGRRRPDADRQPRVPEHVARGGRALAARRRRRRRLPLRRQRHGPGSRRRRLRRRARAAAGHQPEGRTRPRPRAGPEIPPRRISLAWHRDRHRSPAARAFVEVAAEVCAEVAASLAPTPV